MPCCLGRCLSCCSDVSCAPPPPLATHRSTGTARVAVVLEIYPLKVTAELHHVEKLIRAVELSGLVWGENFK